MRPPVVDDAAGAPDWWRRAAKLSRLPIVAIVVLLVILFRAFQSSPPPALTTSCTKPAVALSATSIQANHPVRWSATGPAGMVFELTLGVARFDVDATGTLLVVPEDGHPKSATQKASQQQTMPTSCKASGTFGIVVPPGRYTVKMFRLSGPVSAPTAEVVATMPLTVTK